jgi:hypothetical protein
MRRSLDHPSLGGCDLGIKLRAAVFDNRAMEQFDFIEVPL